MASVGLVVLVSAAGGYFAVQKLVELARSNSSPAVAPQALGNEPVAGAADGDTLEAALARPPRHASITATQKVWEPDAELALSLTREESAGSYKVQLPAQAAKGRSDSERFSFNLKGDASANSGVLVVAIAPDSGGLAERMASVEKVIGQINTDHHGRTERGVLDGHLAYRTEYAHRTAAGNHVEVCAFFVLHDRDTLHLSVMFGSRDTREFQLMENAARTASMNSFNPQI
jgi:hypothetical protein